MRLVGVKAGNTMLELALPLASSFVACFSNLID
jgi:hypothetical protein